MRNPLLAFNALFVVLGRNRFGLFGCLRTGTQARKIEGVRFAPGALYVCG